MLIMKKYLIFIVLIVLVVSIAGCVQDKTTDLKIVSIEHGREDRSNLGCVSCGMGDYLAVTVRNEGTETFSGRYNAQNKLWICGSGLKIEQNSFECGDDYLFYREGAGYITDFQDGLINFVIEPKQEKTLYVMIQKVDGAYNSTAICGKTFNVNLVTQNTNVQGELIFPPYILDKSSINIAC